CELCAAGHARSDDGECLPTVLVMGGGTVPGNGQSSGDDGSAGAPGGQGSASCDDIGCGEHGRCMEMSGQVYCLCSPEYTGKVCESCAAGHFRDSQDACKPVEKC